MKAYYILAVQYEKGDLWAVDFGDYSKDVVIQEKEDTQHNVYKSKVIKTVDNYNYVTILATLNK